MKATSYFPLIPLLLLLGGAIVCSAKNEVLGQPTVSCSADAIYVKIRTRETFAGHITVRYAPNTVCYQVLVTNNQIEVLVPHQDCALPRKRLHSPEGVVVSAELVVSFHPDFLTNDALVYRFECRHTRKDDGKLEAGTQQTALTEDPHAHDGPLCQYRIKSSQNGHPLHSASIGDVVFHEWSCQNTGPDQCLLVRSCFFVTPETRYPLVDADGCSLDQYVLPQLHYFDHRLVAQNVSVFGVAQRPVVFFECELALTERDDHGCQPPVCGKDSTVHRRTPRTLHSIEAQSQRLEISEMHNPHETDDMARSLDMALVECAQPNEESNSRLVCLSTLSLALRSKIRIEQNRPKPIDLLIRYIDYAEEPSDLSEKERQEEFELEEPSK
ncbi:unnamed protein product, partial [Mesorhabditis spiculigera]